MTGLVIRISEALRRFVSTRRILWALGAMVIVLAAMQAAPFGSRAMKALAPGGPLDMSFAWSPNRAAILFGSLGASGRALYCRFLALDLAFILCSAWFQSLTISRLFLRARLSERFGAVNLLPYAKAVFDFLENVLIFAALTAFPASFPALAIAASLATSIKWILYYACVATLFGLGAATSMTGRRTVMTSAAKGAV